MIPVLTPPQAVRFLFAKQGLLGKRRFSGKNGALEYIRQAGCVQFDPVDLCGKNADLTLQSRIAGYRPEWLYSLLYDERKLIDFYDKNQSILPLEDWPLMEESRDWFWENPRSREAVDGVRGLVKDAIRARGPLCSRHLDMPEKVSWFWSDSALSRVALETMYYDGELIIHHKEGTIKHYALTEDYVPESLRLGSDSRSREERRELRVLRRIGAVGLLWNRRSDAFLFLRGLDNPERDRIFSTLEENGKIVRIRVEGLKDDLFVKSEDLPLLDTVVAGGKRPSPRVEFLAPLDPMLWDRNLIRALAGFDYTWEIYTPADKMKYGHYVLPVIWEDRFAGRIECVRDRKQGVLEVRNLWFEADWKAPKTFAPAFSEALRRFASFNDCQTISDTKNLLP